MLKKPWLILLLVCVALLGCQQDETKSGQPKENTGTSKTQKTTEEKETYSLIGEEIEKEPAGHLFEKYIGKKSLLIKKSMKKQKKKL